MEYYNPEFESYNSNDDVPTEELPAGANDGWFYN